MGHHRSRAATVGPYRIMRTRDAVTGASGIPVGYGILAAVYAVLVVAVFWTLWKLAKSTMPPEPAPGVPEPVKDPV